MKKVLDSPALMWYIIVTEGKEKPKKPERKTKC